MVTVEGKGGIKATVIAHSRSTIDGKEMLSFEVEFPRWILAELNTHRMLSKNGSSSRAIPIEAAITNLEAANVGPLFWGKNQSGMVSQDVEVQHVKAVEDLWNYGRTQAVYVSRELSKHSLHKQWCGRVIEPYILQKMIVSGTEWANFFWLRNHKDAQPEFRELARCMFKAKEESIPVNLNPGEWHLPYFGDGYWKPEEQLDDENGGFVWTMRVEGNSSNPEAYYTLEEAQMISSSCVAQTSYRKHDDSLEKAQAIYKRLIESEPCHASPFEALATPMPEDVGLDYPGVTAYHNTLKYMSGNLSSWIQYRQIIPNHCKW